MLNSRLVIMHNSILDVTLLSAPVSATSEWPIVSWARLSLSLILSALRCPIHSIALLPDVFLLTLRSHTHSLDGLSTDNLMATAVSQGLILECREESLGVQGRRLLESQLEAWNTCCRTTSLGNWICISWKSHCDSSPRTTRPSNRYPAMLVSAPLFTSRLCGRSSAEAHDSYDRT